MKHLKEMTVILVLVVAGVAYSLQAQEESKKPAAPASKKCACCSKMKTTPEGKTACCSSDSTGAKDGKSGPEKR